MPDEQTKWNRVKERAPGQEKKPFVAKYSAAASQPFAPPSGPDPYVDEARRDRVIFIWTLGVLGFLISAGLLVYFLR